MRSLIYAAEVTRELERRDAWLEERGLLRPVAVRPRLLAAQTSDGDGDLAELWIYDVIIPFWGISARDFAAEMRATVKKDQRLLIHVNSEGGDVFEGIAIYNTIAAHPSEVTIRVEGQAASIASVIAQAGDRVLMAPHSSMFIHDAWGVTMGPEEDHRKTADMLKDLSNEIASIYAERSKTGARTWRQRMKEEAQYNAEKSVELGLADAIDRTVKSTADAAALRDAAIRAKRDPEETLRDAGYSRRVAKALLSDVEEVNRLLDQGLTLRDAADAEKEAARAQRAAEVEELRRASLRR